MPARTATKTAENAFKTIEATVTSKGQVTLPKALRKELGIDAGSRVRFTLGSNGKAQVEKVAYSLDDLWRMADAREKPKGRMSFEEMDEAKARRIW
ncbi:MAG: AbrB/MazE/SpoVT family DNA-binding domain-containing protein [Terracidiphilus sp.]|jgi:AbrB family looped-hinge helix DNA binding protein